MTSNFFPAGLGSARSNIFRLRLWRPGLALPDPLAAIGGLHLTGGERREGDDKEREGRNGLGWEGKEDERTGPTFTLLFTRRHCNE